MKSIEDPVERNKFNSFKTFDKDDSGGETSSLEEQKHIFKPKFDRLRSLPKSNAPIVVKNIPKEMEYDIEIKDDEKAHSSKVAKITFKTAREQFLGSNPAAKRSLGATRKAQAKFISPMIAQYVN